MCGEHFLMHEGRVISDGKSEWIEARRLTGFSPPVRYPSSFDRLRHISSFPSIAASSNSKYFVVNSSE